MLYGGSRSKGDGAHRASRRYLNQGINPSSSRVGRPVARANTATATAGVALNPVAAEMPNRLPGTAVVAHATKSTCQQQWRTPPKRQAGNDVPFYEGLTVALAKRLPNSKKGYFADSRPQRPRGAKPAMAPHEWIEPSDYQWPLKQRGCGPSTASQFQFRPAPCDSWILASGNGRSPFSTPLGLAPIFSVGSNLAAAKNAAATADSVG